MIVEEDKYSWIADYLPILQAYAEGKIIQFLNDKGEWEPTQNIYSTIHVERYRIKPTEYRVFWHELSEDKNDLPPKLPGIRDISDIVQLEIDNWGPEWGYYDYRNRCWVRSNGRIMHKNTPILAWCEIARYKK